MTIYKVYIDAFHTLCKVYVVRVKKSARKRQGTGFDPPRECYRAVICVHARRPDGGAEF